MDYTTYLVRCDLLRLLFVTKVSSALHCGINDQMKVGWIEKDLKDLTEELDALKAEYMNSNENIDPFVDESEQVCIKQ